MLTTAWARDPLRVFDTGLGLTNMGVTEADVNRGRLNLPLAGLMLLDALETENEFKVIIECPGVDKDKIDVSVDNGLLVIKVNKPNPDYPQGHVMLVNEIPYGTSTRSIRIPRGYHPEPAHCSFKDSRLCIAFPKSQQAEAKKLQIQSS